MSTEMNSTSRIFVSATSEILSLTHMKHTVNIFRELRMGQTANGNTVGILVLVIEKFQSKLARKSREKMPR